MKIQSIKNENTFEARSIPKSLQNNISRLKLRMDADAVILQTQEKRQTVRVRGLEIDGEAKFKDGRFLAKRDKHNKLVPYGADTVMIEFDNVKFVTDSEGNIVYHKKPWYMKWAGIFEKAGVYVQTALDNYKDEHRVVKQMNKQDNLTAEGKKQLEKEYQKIMDVFNKINPFKE